LPKYPRHQWPSDGWLKIQIAQSFKVSSIDSDYSLRISDSECKNRLHEALTNQLPDALTLQSNRVLGELREITVITLTAGMIESTSTVQARYGPRKLLSAKSLLGGERHLHQGDWYMQETPKKEA